MKRNRYGKFRFSDYFISWFSIVVLFFFSITSIILKLSPIFIIFPTVFGVIWLSVIVVPHYEQFILDNDSITVFHGKNTHTITIPSELTLVVSYADIRPPFARRTAVRNQTHILKDKYSISILQKTSLDVAIEALHRNYVSKYTNSTIQDVFDDYRYIYSCVCNQSLLDELIANRRYLLIVPESLLHVVSIDFNSKNVYVDVGH